MKYPSRNRKKEIDNDPIETACPYCNHKQLVTSDNTELLFTQTVSYWCESCHQQYLQGMRVYEYKYS